jgi:16S rRNA (cytosine967-C5)-methyltransferase
MTPGARIQTAIELLELILQPPAGRQDVPADTVVSGYLRGRRYIGSKDRRAINGLVFGALRHRAEIAWRLDARELTPRLMAIGALGILDDWQSVDLTRAFDGGLYRPDPLTGAETEAVAAVKTDRGQRPLAARANLPAWLAEKFGDAFGAAAADEADAMHGPPPVDLRVNSLKCNRDVALAALAADGIDAAVTALSPLGLRLSGRRPLGNSTAWRNGLVEVQDEGSQLCALLTGAAPGEAVLDYCAGAGGKALALAAMMVDKGRLLATDVDPRRLGSLGKRAARAGATIIETRALNGGGPEPGTFDCVVVDAPCSGSGAWRRHPEAPWRLTEAGFQAYLDLQQAILAQAAGHVRPGGRLAYITCSVFPAENQQQVARFLDAHGGFAADDMAGIWRETLPGDPPTGAGPEGLLLTPHRTGTDGFYMARLRRAG